MKSHETVSREPLEELARDISRCGSAAYDKVLQAARLVKEARERVEAGEAGGVSWADWASEHIQLSPSRLRELMRIARADDATTELERTREQTRARARRHRSKANAAPLRNGGSTLGEPAERQRLIEWVKKAPLEQIKEVQAHIESAYGDDTLAREDVAA